MKLHTSGFKNQIKMAGREIDVKITYNNNGESVTLTSEDINTLTSSFHGNILKSVMKELEFDSNVDIPMDTIIHLEFGIKVDDNYEYLDFGNYIVYLSERQEDTNSYKISCYDKMLHSMKTNDNLGITYPITIHDYINALCDKLGLAFSNKNTEFVNYDRIIEKELYFGLDYTYRDILDELAQVTASTICLNNNDELEIRYINNTNDIIDEEFLKDVNVKFGTKYGPINSIVLSRSAESDNVYLRDEESISKNGLCEVKICDNQIMNWNDRSDYLPQLLEKLNGLEYYINDFTSTGIGYYDLCDRYNVQVGEEKYSCIMFNDELEINQGIVENIFTEMPNESETDYSKADKTDRRINQVYIIADKQGKQIEALVSETIETKKNLNNLSTPILTKEGNNHLCIEEALESNAIEYNIEGKCEQESEPNPSNPIEIKTIKGIKDIDESHNGYWLKSKITNSEEETDLYEEQDILVDFNKPNLFDGVVEEGNISTDNGNNSTASNAWRCTNYISIENVINTLEIEGLEFNGTAGRIYYYDEDKNYTHNTLIEKLPFTFHASSSTKYIRFFILKDVAPMDSNLKIYEGYSPYYELCSIGNVRDTLEITSGKLIKRIGKIILDGSESWNHYVTNNINRFVLSLTNAKASSFIKSNYFDGITDLSKWNAYYNGSIASNGQLILCHDIDNLTNFKEFLQEQYDNGTPVVVYYQLADLEEKQLEPTNVPLFENENHIQLEEDIETNTSIKYYRKSALNEAYYTKSENDAQFKITSDQINSTVSSTKTELKNDLNDLNNNLNNNFYQKTQVEQLILDSSNGLTNTFSEAGGNNILRNTNFSAKEVLEEGQIYEYWYGNALRNVNSYSANSYSIILQNNSFYQEQTLANGNYTLSFFYKKTNPLAKVYVKINDNQYELDSTDFSLFQTGTKDENESYIIEPIVITDNHVKVEFICDINNACEVYDIMLNAGKVKLAYSQNQNETITDTVNIGRGISIKSSASDTEFVANNEAMGFKNNSGKFTTEFNSKGMSTNEAVIKDEAEIVGILRQKVGDQIWDCMI